MINLGLSAAELALYTRSLTTGYNLKVTVNILDLNHRYITDVSSMLVDGQVDHNFSEPITYAASMTLLDPNNLTGFDTSSPADNALYADRMIKVVYSIWSDLLPRWVDCPIFCGPVTAVSRDDALVSVECQGKESLTSEPNLAWKPKTYAKGQRLTTLIRDVMATYGGETRFDLEGLTTTTTRAYSILQETVPWTFARAVTGSQAYRHLFYDGRGYLRLRSTPGTPYFTFGEAALLSVPKLKFNSGDIRNTALVKGATPDGKPQLKAARYLPSTHPASPQALAIGGKPRYLVEVIDDSNLATQAAVNAAAVNSINQYQNSNVDFDFDSFVFPHMEPGDLFTLQTRDYSILLRSSQFSIPLKGGTPQSNGVTRKLAANKARLKRK